MDKVHLGSKNILTLRKNDLSKILKSNNPVLNFDNLAKENTIFDKYRPEQKFFLLDNENNMMGYYELNENKTVLKVSPSIEGRNSEFVNEYGDIKAWGILLSEKLPPVDYYLALNNIQKEKIKPFGIDNILIENFNKNDRKKRPRPAADRVRRTGPVTMTPRPATVEGAGCQSPLRPEPRMLGGTFSTGADRTFSVHTPLAGGEERTRRRCRQLTSHRVLRWLPRWPSTSTQFNVREL